MQVSQLAKNSWLRDGPEFQILSCNDQPETNAALIDTMRLENGKVLDSPEKNDHGVVQYFQEFLNCHQTLENEISITLSLQKSLRKKLSQ